MTAVADRVDVRRGRKMAEDWVERYTRGPPATVWGGRKACGSRGRLCEEEGKPAEAAGGCVGRKESLREPRAVV